MLWRYLPFSNMIVSTSILSVKLFLYCPFLISSLSFVPSSVCGALPPFLSFLIMTHNADDITETSNSGSNKIIEDCIASSENLASDGTTSVFVEVTTNEASSSKNNLSFEYSSTKVVIEDNAEVSGFNKDLARSNVSGTYSSSIEVYHSHASK